MIIENGYWKCLKPFTNRILNVKKPFMRIDMGYHTCLYYISIANILL